MTTGRQEQAQAKVRASVEVLREFTQGCLQKVGVSREDSLIAADIISSGSMRKTSLRCLVCWSNQSCQ